jgi:glycerol kinase
MRYLLGIDQGTSGSRALVLDQAGQPLGYGYRPLERLYPQPDWVEQDPQEVCRTVQQAIQEALGQAGVSPVEIAAVGIACQRNTGFVWEAGTLKPLGNAITWQDLRTQSMMSEVEAWPGIGEARRRLGRLPATVSAALHMAWRVKHDPPVRAAAQANTLRMGFSAEWLLAAMGRLDGHVMDYTLVQAGGLYDFRRERYWQEWLDFLGLDEAIFPQPRPTVYPYGCLRIAEGVEAPVWAMIGDQQAALFGYDCRSPGDAECTHGTASFVNVCLGNTAPEQERLNVYYAWHLGRPTYCLEADTTVTGAALRWMAQSARLLDREDQVGELAGSVPDSGGVTFVPAFTGLNVPYDRPQARGALLGLTLGTTRGHIARAFLEAIGFQIRHILDTIRQDVGVTVDRLSVGGGISASDLACQVQADLTGIPVARPAFTQTTARAAALLAGLGAGCWASEADLPPLPGEVRVFEPMMGSAQREEAFARWLQAIG